MQILVHLLWLLSVVANWTLLVQLPLTANLAVADNQNNFYVADDRNTLLKLDSMGNELYRYNRTSGKLTNVDVSNPFKPLLFYTGSQTIVVTDNTLTPASTLDLQPLGFTQVTSACKSSDDKIWLYDAADFRLKKLDYNGTAVREGTDLLQQTGFPPDVRFMLEHEQKMYLCDSAHGVLVTDLYGNYEKTISITGLQHFQFVNNQLVYFNNASMLFYDLRTAQTDSLPLTGVATCHQAVYNNGKLLALEQNRVSLYRLAKR